MKESNGCRMDATPPESGKVIMTLCSEPLKCPDCKEVLDFLNEDEALQIIRKLPCPAHVSRFSIEIPAVESNSKLYSFDYLEKLVSFAVLYHKKAEKPLLERKKPVLNLFFTRRDEGSIPHIRAEVLILGKISQKIMESTKSAVLDTFKEFDLIVDYDYHYGGEFDYNLERLYIKVLYEGLPDISNFPEAEAWGLTSQHINEMNMLNGVRLKRLKEVVSIKDGVIGFLDLERELIKSKSEDEAETEYAPFL